MDENVSNDDAAVKLRLITENLNDLVTVVNQKGQIEYINETTHKKVMGFSFNELKSKSAFELVHPEDADKVMSSFNDCFEKGEGTVEARILNKHGEYVWIETNAKSFIDSDNRKKILTIGRDITECKNTEKRIKESEEKYKLLLENAQEGIWVIDTNAKVTYANEQIAEMLGYTVEELIGTKIFKYMSEESIRDAKDQLERRNQGIKDKIQRKFVQKNGNEIITILETSSINDEKGNFIGAIACVVDITESKKAEERLKESEEQFRLTFEQAAVGIAHVSPQGRFLRINQKLCDILKYDHDELLSLSFLEITHPNDLEDNLDALNKLIKGEISVYNTEKRYNRGDGNLMWANLTVSAKRNLNNELEYFISVVEDISERKEAEQKLEHSEEKYRNLFENSPYFIVMLDSSGKVVDCNPATEKILGYTRDGFINREILDLIKSSSNRQIIIERFTLVKKEEKLDPIELLLSKKDGTPIWVRTIGTLFKIGDKTFINVIGQDITNQKLSQQKLKESEEKFRYITEQVLMGIALIQDDVIIHANQRLADIFGYTLEEILNWEPNGFLKNIAPESLEMVIEQVKKKQRGDPNITNHYEFMGIRKSGEKVWIENFSKTIDYGGRPADLVTLIDITEKKKTEQKLKESEEKFRNIANQSFMGIYILVDNIFKYLNQAVADIVGLTVEDILKFSIDDIARFIHPDDYHLLSDTHRRIIEGETVEPYESRVFHKSGELKWIESYSKRIFYDGKPAILTSIVDITDRKKAEELIKESEEKFRSITEESLLGISIIQDDVIKYVNQEMADLYGYTVEEMLNWEPNELLKVVAPESMEETKEQLKKKQAGDPDAIAHYPIQCVKKSGERIWVDNISKTMMYKGRPADLVTQVDITRQKKAEEELVKLTNLKSELMRRTSHELKTPLVSIKGYTELLEIMHGKNLDYNGIEIINEINQGCIRLETLIKDILKTSELESGTIELKKTQENLISIIELVARELQGLTTLRKHEIVLDLDENITIFLEKEQIHLVISNLLSNAIKYTPPNGKIEVKTQIERYFVKVLVKDNGIGITPDERKRIFQQFGKIERYGRGFDVISEGSGLGLYNAKKIIELHGGEIWVESEGRGKGSTFYFTLPLLS